MKNPFMASSAQRIMADTPVSELLKGFFKDNNREDQFQLHLAKELFLQAIPKTYKSMIRKVWCRDQKLFVSTLNASLKFELLNQRSFFRNRLNEKLGKDVVKEIVVL